MVNQSVPAIHQCPRYGFPFTRSWRRLDSLSGKRQTLKLVTLGMPVHRGPVQGGSLRRLILLLLIAAVGTVVAQRAEYPGPTILSRGMGTALQGGGELLELRPYLSLNGIYDSALTSVSVDQQGRIPQTDGYGAEVGFGLYGYHNWRHSMLGVDYRGDVRHYNRKTYYDGTDHNLTLGFTHQPTRRLSFTLKEAAGMYSRSYGWFNGYQFFDPAYANVPTNELFDGRTIYMSTMGDLTYSKSPRLSFNVGGSGMVVRRRSQSLIGTTGWYGPRRCSIPREPDAYGWGGLQFLALRVHRFIRRFGYPHRVRGSLPPAGPPMGPGIACRRRPRGEPGASEFRR